MNYKLLILTIIFDRNLWELIKVLNIENYKTVKIRIKFHRIFAKIKSISN